jgi:hypothetical protein
VFVKSIDLQKSISQPVQELSTKLLSLATSFWQILKDRPEVAQEIAKDPFTGEIKGDAAAAELLLLLLHACDRVASATFTVALPAQAATILRNTFMAALVGTTVAEFVRATCPEEDAEEQEETRADLVHLYNMRATQYGFFSLGNAKTADSDALFTVAGIRLAEALECPDNADIITHGVETVVESLLALRQQIPLQENFGRLIAGMQ